jgi:hypothetical protein
MKFIAERRLLYSLKGHNVRHELIIRLGVPYVAKEHVVGFPIGKDVYGCHVEIDGIEEMDAIYPEVYGADSLQAINIASNVETFLKRLGKKYDLYWLSGDPYFQ